MLSVAKTCSCTTLDQVPAALSLIYEGNTEYQRVLRSNGYGDYASEISRLGEDLPTLPLTAQNLDDWSARTHTNPQFLRALIRPIPGEVALKLFGAEAVIWAISDMRSDFQRFSQFLDALEGVGYVKASLYMAIEAAREHADQFGGAHVTASMIIGQYRIFEAIKAEPDTYGDLRRVLNESRVCSAPLSTPRLQSYSVAPLILDTVRYGYSNYNPDWDAAREHLGQKVYYSLFMDAPTGFVLSYKGLPQAIVTFLGINEQSISIQQLQGLVGRTRLTESAKDNRTIIHSRGLCPLNFEDALIRFTASFAASNGFNELTVQSGAGNNWINDDPRAVLRYDKPAERLGMVLQPSGVWRGNLPLQLGQ